MRVFYNNERIQKQVEIIGSLSWIAIKLLININYSYIKKTQIFVFKATKRIKFNADCSGT
jgi:hypothetical protein